MKKAFLSLLVILVTGFIYNNKCYSDNGNTNSINNSKKNNMICLSIMGKYSFLGILNVAPYSNQGHVYVYTDGYSYYCSHFRPSEVECRSDNELKESRLFRMIYEDDKGCYSLNYYGEKYYLYNPDTNRIVQDVEREVYYADWME